LHQNKSIFTNLPIKIKSVQYFVLSSVKNVTTLETNCMTNLI